MKTLLTISLIVALAFTAQAKDLGTTIVTVGAVPAGSPTPTPPTGDRAKQVILIFSTDFVGTVAGACFAGTAGACATGSPADGQLALPAPAGDTLLSIPVTVSAGSIRIVKVQ